MVLEYEMAAGAFGLLTVVSDGVEPFFYRLDSARTGRQQLILPLPPRFGDTPRVGWYFVRASFDGPGEMRPVFLRVFGLGAGEKAVGSVGIDEVRFQPGSIRPGQRERATYSFHARSDFNKVSAEFLRVGLLNNNQVVANLVDEDSVGDVRQNETIRPRTWDGKGGKVNKELNGKPSLGQHLLQVRAWMGSKKAGDWVIAWSDEVVQVEE